jgi:hypothetical protein
LSLLTTHPRRERSVDDSNDSDDEEKAENTESSEEGEAAGENSISTQMVWYPFSGVTIKSAGNNNS